MRTTKDDILPTAHLKTPPLLLTESKPDNTESSIAPNNQYTPITEFVHGHKDKCILHGDMHTQETARLPPTAHPPPPKDKRNSWANEASPTSPLPDRKIWITTPPA